MQHILLLENSDSFSVPEQKLTEISVVVSYIRDWDGIEKDKRRQELKDRVGKKIN